MTRLGKNSTSKAFALPTVLIASIVLLAILAVSVTATATVRETLKAQYYTQLAQVAGEAGVAYAKACLAANGNVPLWTDAKPLTPATDCSGNLILSPTVKALVVGGGGSGGGSTGGGGGAGGVIYDDSVTITATTFPVVIGAGGAIPGNKASGNSGQNSSFNGIVANGGGGGAHSANASTGSIGENGGSGGGGQNYSTAAFAPGTGIAGQGFAGAPGGNASAGGGGGAGGAGTTSGTLNIGGNGGPGVQYNITGSMVYYGAGGGGGNGGVAGIGGNQTPGPGTGQAPSAAANTGNGGTGGWGYTDGNGGAGGSGVVIISYPINSGITATGGTITTSGGNRIHRFTANGNFVVTSTGTLSCPTAPACSVTINGNVRSSFSVSRPTLDSQGRAVTIPNSGYVELFRSNGITWRTYRQPSVQNAVAPDLCSGNATAARGWAAAVRSSAQDALPSASSAQSITMADTALYGGQMYFRKDFSVSKSGTYDFNLLTTNTQDIAEGFLDSQYITTSSGSLATASPTLTAGCHTLMVRLTQASTLSRTSDFTFSLTQAGNAVPLVVSDTSWRVSAGDPQHFSQTNYYEAPSTWDRVTVHGVWNNTALAWGGAPSNWSTISGDALAGWVSTRVSSGGVNRPANSYAWFRQSTPFTLASPTTVRVTGMCDDSCDIYLDGQLLFTANYAAAASSKLITIQPGTHTFGIRLYNVALNAAGFLFAATNTSNGTVIARSDAGWESTNFWTTTAANPYSYDAAFLPTPNSIGAVTAKLLVVGGGGGGGSGMGGGGGGGAVVANNTYTMTIGDYPITVGAGGTGGPAGTAQVRGTNGGDSRFGTVFAIGGGGGASDYGTNNNPPGYGASAGGSAGSTQTYNAGGAIGYGFNSVPTAGSFYPTGGGGAGGAGATNPATGGVGVSNSILGTAYFWGGGGGGSGYTSIGGNGGAGGGGGGAIGVTTGGSGLNAGSAGGGGAQVTQANRPGGDAGARTGGGGGGGSHFNSNNRGGNGGSGSVVLSFPTGSLSYTTTAPFTDYSGSTPGFTTLLFTGSGTFTVNSVTN